MSAAKNESNNNTTIISIAAPDRLWKAADWVVKVLTDSLDKTLTQYQTSDLPALGRSIAGIRTVECTERDKRKVPSNVAVPLDVEAVVEDAPHASKRLVSM